jgi:predicted kinase
MLIGIPCSGKSTWIENQEWAKDCAVISTDTYVEAYAAAVNKTYSEVFEMYMPKAVELMTNDVITAHAENKDIIWDQTSLTKASRLRKFKMLPNYYAIAVVFPVPEKEELYCRLMSRPGKIIPEHVIERMIEQYQSPKMNEGFKEIWYAN